MKKKQIKKYTRQKSFKCISSSLCLSVSLSSCQTDSVSSVSLSLCQFVTLSVCHSASLSLSVRHSVSSLLSQLVSLSVCSFITLSVRIVVRHSVSSSLCQFVTVSSSLIQIHFWGGFHVERDQLRGESKFEVNKLAKDVKDATLSMYDHYLRCIFSIACCKIVSMTIFRTDDEANRRIIKQ